MKTKIFPCFNDFYMTCFQHQRFLSTANFFFFLRKKKEDNLLPKLKGKESQHDFNKTDRELESKGGFVNK